MLGEEIWHNLKPLLNTGGIQGKEKFNQHHYSQRMRVTSLSHSYLQQLDINIQINLAQVQACPQQSPACVTVASLRPCLKMQVPMNLCP